MTKRYRVLQKKLKELELELGHAFSRPSPGSVFKIQNNQLYSEDIEQRLSFLKSLLSAEIASSPRKPHHLEHIGRRLVEVEAAFRDWGQARSTGCGIVDFPEAEEEEEEEEDHLNGDTCSCTESCLNDDGGSVSVEEELLLDDEENKEEEEEENDEGLVRVDGVKYYEKLLMEGEDQFNIGDGGLDYNKEKKNGDGNIYNNNKNNKNNNNKFYEGLVGGVVIGVGMMGLVMFNLCFCCYSSSSSSMYVLPPT